MIRRKRVRELKAELQKAQEQTAAVTKAGKAREPLLRRLERQLEDNGFAERLVASMEQSRRRRLT